MGGTGVSKSEVSRLCGEIDERVGAVLDRPIEDRPIEGGRPSLGLDATYVKARCDGRVVSVAVIAAVAVNTHARRAVLGATVGSSEAAPLWTEFLRSLSRRGLRGVKRVISDAPAGRKAAASRVHVLRNAMQHAGRTQRRIVSAWSARRSPRPTRRPRAGRGGRSPTSSGRASASLPS